MSVAATCELKHLALAESRLATATVLLDGEIVDANRTFAELLGEPSPQQVLSRNLREWCSAPHEFDAFLASANQGMAQQEWSIRRSDGAARILAVTARRLAPEQSVVAARELLVADITERRQLELQLQQSQKMEALGRLAGGVAHDFNNLLMVIRGNCELMLLRSDPDEALATRIQTIAKATEQGARLTRQLLAFSRRQVLQPRELDINPALLELQSMLAHLIGEDIEVQLDLAPGPLHTLIDGGQLHQVLLNLAVNARDAMPLGGRLHISSSRRTVLAEDIHRQGEVDAGEYVVIQVADNGVGMDAETQQRIFEPFFTTKEQGTGLGLSTVYGILRQSRGGIYVESRFGVGTTFFIYLPAIHADKSVENESAEPTAAASAATILVVEDEDLVRNGTAEFLELNGYTVLTACDGVEGLDVSAAHPEIDLIVTDVVMPRLRGSQMAIEICRRRPELPVLFTSGYTEIPLDLSRFARAAMLYKPFALAEITRQIGRLLEAPINGASRSPHEATS